LLQGFARTPEKATYVNLSRNGGFSGGRHAGFVWGVTNSSSLCLVTLYVGDCGQGEKRKPDGVRTRIDYGGESWFALNRDEIENKKSGKRNLHCANPTRQLVLASNG